MCCISGWKCFSMAKSIQDQSWDYVRVHFAWFQTLALNFMSNHLPCWTQWGHICLRVPNKVMPQNMRGVAGHCLHGRDVDLWTIKSHTSAHTHVPTVGLVATKWLLKDDVMLIKHASPRHWHLVHQRATLGLKLLLQVSVFHSLGVC